MERIVAWSVQDFLSNENGNSWAISLKYILFLF